MAGEWWLLTVVRSRITSDLSALTVDLIRLTVDFLGLKEGWTGMTVDFSGLTGDSAWLTANSTGLTVDLFRVTVNLFGLAGRRRSFGLAWEKVGACAVSAGQNWICTRSQTRHRARPCLILFPMCWRSAMPRAR